MVTWWGRVVFLVVAVVGLATATEGSTHGTAQIEAAPAPSPEGMGLVGVDVNDARGVMWDAGEIYNVNGRFIKF